MDGLRAIPYRGRLSHAKPATRTPPDEGVVDGAGVPLATAPDTPESGYPLGWESAARVPSLTIGLRLIPDTRVTALRLGARCQAGFTVPSQGHARPIWASHGCLEVQWPSVHGVMHAGQMRACATSSSLAVLDRRHEMRQVAPR